MLVRRGLTSLLGLCLVVTGCAYPRRSTSLTPMPSGGAAGAPADVWSVTLDHAVVPPLARGGLSWDPDGGLPDPFVRIYRDDVLVWESETLQDTLSPTWRVALPRNLYAPRDARYRFEVWDRDEVGADPIGIYRSMGLPANMLPGADARVLLEGGGQLGMRIAPPTPHRGVGIRLYELRGDALHVVEVETHSPAGRAGILAGEDIVVIDGQTISSLGSQRAPGALSMAAERRSTMSVRNERGQIREVQLDSGFTWLTL